MQSFAFHTASIAQQSEIVKLSKPIAGIDQFILQHYAEEREGKRLANELQIERYYYICTKE